LSYWGFNPIEARQNSQRANASPLDMEHPYPPTFFEGAGTAAVKGFVSSVDEAVLTAHDFASPYLVKSGLESKETADKISDEGLQTIKSLMPDPRTTGTAGQVTYGLMNILPQVAAGTMIGGPLGAITLPSTIQAYKELRTSLDKGIDPDTSLKLAALTGVTTGIGIGIPVGFGSTIAFKSATGAASNLMLGMLQRGSTGKILEQNGYKDIADQYNAIDGAAMLADVVLGGAFGLFAKHAPETKIPENIPPETVRNPSGWGHIEPTPSMINLALAGNAIRKAHESIPFISANSEAAAAHSEAIRIVSEQLARGEQADIPKNLFEKAQFVVRDGVGFFKDKFDSVIEKKPGENDLESAIRRAIKEHQKDYDIENVSLKELEKQAELRGLRAEHLIVPEDFKGVDMATGEETKPVIKEMMPKTETVEPDLSNPEVSAKEIPDQNGNKTTVEKENKQIDIEAKQAEKKISAMEAAIACFFGD